MKPIISLNVSQGEPSHVIVTMLGERIYEKYRRRCDLKKRSRVTTDMTIKIETKCFLPRSTSICTTCRDSRYVSIKTSIFEESYSSKN